jgi:hypothetical protein
VTFTRTLLAFFLLSCSAFANDLPNDCAIIATEANARLKTSAVWSQVLTIKYFDSENLCIRRHAMTVWQVHKGGTILIYDAGGTLDLQMHSQKANDIVQALNKLNPTLPILEGHFVQ